MDRSTVVVVRVSIVQHSEVLVTIDVVLLITVVARQDLTPIRAYIFRKANNESG
ncbi:MAG: hypothetical protein R3C17_04515 [Planctomycetaceae bacterium]